MFEPSGKLDLVKLAVPLLSALVARTVAPFRKVTVPVGVPADADEIVAVKVTDCPESDGFREETKVVVVGSLLTTWFTAFDLLARNFGSPPYSVSIEWVPTASAEVMKLAEPPLNAPVPKIVVASIKVTISPSGGTPMLEVTTALKVTVCP